jgi:hypothetical protein
MLIANLIEEHGTEKADAMRLPFLAYNVLENY